MRKLKTLLALLVLSFFTIGNVWGQTATCTLSNADIVAGSGSTSYGAASATDGCDNDWNAYAIKNHHSNATSSYKFWQIKKYASSTAYYVQVPEMPGNITSITLTVSSSNKAMDGGGNTSTLFFSASSSTDATGDGVASGTGASSITIDCSDLELTEGYITASGAIRIWDVEVTYSTASSKTLESVAVDGTPTKIAYAVGDAFDPAGLSVTGTYSDATSSAITSGITWTACKTEDGTYVALDNAAVALAQDETGIYVKATASEITSPAFHVTGLSVQAALTDDEFAWNAASFEATKGATNTFPALINTVPVTGVTYQSTATDVATIDANGDITLLTSGSTTIKAVFAGNSSYAPKTVSYTLTVIVPVESVSVKTSTSLEVGTTETLSATVLPAGATDKSVTWASNATSVATVDANGKVTAFAVGTAKISATANDGSGVSDTCVVTVTAAKPKIIINGEPLTSTATTEVSTKKYGNALEDSIDVVLSDGARSYSSKDAENYFGNSNKAILIGKTDKYIYNSTPVPGDIKKFELYANYGASASVQVSVTFSKYPLTAAGTGSDTLYTATLSTLDNVYDCSAKIPDGARYFYYKVTNNYNSQVQFCITYEQAVKSAVTFTAAPSNGTVAVKKGDTPLTSGDLVAEGTTLTIIPTPAEGYILNGVPSVNSGAVTVTGPVDGKYTFTMPAEAAAIAVSFKEGVPAPELDVTAGTYDAEQLVAISNYDDDYMYFYTTDGSDPAADELLDPTGTSQIYDENDGITIDKSCTLKVIAYDLSHNASDVTTAAYVLKCKTPTITKAETHFLDEATITLACTTVGAQIRYTLDGTDPNGESTLFSAPFKIDATKTIKAIAVMANWSNSTIADTTFTKANVITVAAAKELSDGTTNVYISGIVSELQSIDPSKYQRAQYFISDDGNTTSQFLVYNGYYVDGADFTSTDQLVVGDKVLVYGNIGSYKGTTQVAQNNYQISSTHLSSVAVSGTASTTEYAKNAAFDFTGLVATATWADASVMNVTSFAEWTASPATITADANVNVTATWCEKTSAAKVVAVTVTETGFVNLESDAKAVKVLKDGQIYILRGEKVYTIQGQLVK